MEKNKGEERERERERELTTSRVGRVAEGFSHDDWSLNVWSIYSQLDQDEIQYILLNKSEDHRVE